MTSRPAPHRSAEQGGDNTKAVVLSGRSMSIATVALNDCKTINRGLDRHTTPWA